MYIPAATLNEIVTKRSAFACLPSYRPDGTTEAKLGSLGNVLVSPLGTFLAPDNGAGKKSAWVQITGHKGASNSSRSHSTHAMQRTL